MPGQATGGLGVPYGIRTRVAAVKGQCPRPLDEGNEAEERLRYRLERRKSSEHRACRRCGIIDLQADGFAAAETVDPQRPRRPVDLDPGVGGSGEYA